MTCLWCSKSCADRLCAACRKKAPKREQREPSASAAHWDGSYGNGSGKAKICVKFVRCPKCKAMPGKLCIGAHGYPTFGIHYMRSENYVVGLQTARLPTVIG